MLCKATTAILYSSLIAKGYNSLTDDMRIPARVSQWVKLTNEEATSIQALVGFVQTFLFKVSTTHTLQRYYLTYIIYYQHCHIDRESIYRRAKTNVVVAAPTSPIAASATAECGCYNGINMQLGQVLF